jgi:hypothetical protein
VQNGANGSLGHQVLVVDHLTVVCQVQTSVTKASVEAVLTGPLEHIHTLLY